MNGWWKLRKLFKMGSSDIYILLDNVFLKDILLSTHAAWFPGSPTLLWSFSVVASAAALNAGTDTEKNRRENKSHSLQNEWRATIKCRSMKCGSSKSEVRNNGAVLNCRSSTGKFLSTVLAAGDQICGPLWEDVWELCHELQREEKHTHAHTE